MSGTEQKIAMGQQLTTKPERRQIQHWEELKAEYAGEQASLWDRARQVVDVLSTVPGAEVYVAGGFVRDVLLERKPADIDLATNLTTEQVEEVLRRVFADDVERGHLQFNFTGKRFGVLRVKWVTEEVPVEVEVATFRQDSKQGDGRRPDSVQFTGSLVEDAARRDFTLNALYYNPVTGEVLDSVGGMQDIHQKVVRFVGQPEERIAEDFLRLQRFARMLLKTGFTAEDGSRMAVRKAASEINRLPAEPVVMELYKSMKDSGHQFGRVLEVYEDLGLLEQILPEVASLRQCEQGPPYHMEGDVLTHTVMVANALPEDASFDLVLAAYLHDIAKPQTRAEKILPEGGRKVSFHRHGELGSAMSGKVTDRLKLSNFSQKKVAWLVAHHLDPFSMAQWKSFAKVADFVNHPYFTELAALATADISGSQPNTAELAEKNKQEIFAVKQRTAEVREFFDTHRKVLLEIESDLSSGHALIARFKELKNETLQGRAIGELKERVAKQLLDEKVVTKTRAQEVIDQQIRQFKA